MSDRREQIVDAAAHVAAENGLASLSVRVVAARAGLGASTLRHYFPTQADLYHAVVGRLLHPHLDDLRIQDRDASATERLAECMGQFLPRKEDHAAQLESWLAAYALAVGPERTDNGAHLLASMAQHARERVDGWLAVLESEGSLRGTDRGRHVTTLLAVVDGLCLELVTPGSLTTVELAHSILDEVIENVVVVS
ncbi:TetR/AcrR family transcriptional regulator [Phytoactinopolyspora alkaliphila]|uniref:TetR/AcrR family transcriptional regulator n=1 Tax=Phytoactinopolyspora alkaliphila TaxID=1783498 RepID=A0A6N9YP26_9ACTN|nr:TetR/AcrR family transcriptional regulator [Phytoactinopolyspora alkaliphila]NED96680.1 TetR/AcrR family transcriptional regulator [Phytoactinopolyspora alkaliphila]